LSANEECALKPKDVFNECDKCPKMVVVPAGSFTMGSPSTEKGRFVYEDPQHSVRVSRPFAIGMFHVTVDQFAAFVTDAGYDPGSKCETWETGKWEEHEGRSWRDPGFAQSGSDPVVCVSWNDAKAYAAWLSRKTGKSYRLVTEAEFEYAARAGTKTRFFFGDDEKDMCRYGNGLDQTAESKVPGHLFTTSYLPCADGYAYTSPIGSFSPNAFGLYDMHGNAFELLEDCWHDDYKGAPSDSSAWTRGECKYRVIRGGSWIDVTQDLRAAARSSGTASARHYDYGFRLARSLTP
jgi:formylglycine-generating enzyme required for sulfatase activity